MNIVTTIQSVINTLDKVNVSGVQNFDRLLACVQTLDQVKGEVEKLEAIAANYYAQELAAKQTEQEVAAE